MVANSVTALNVRYTFAWYPFISQNARPQWNMVNISYISLFYFVCILNLAAALEHQTMFLAKSSEVGLIAAWVQGWEFSLKSIGKKFVTRTGRSVNAGERNLFTNANNYSWKVICYIRPAVKRELGIRKESINSSIRETTAVAFSLGSL